MIAKVSFEKAGGEVRVIPSKSVAHRMLICAALSDEPCEIVCPASSLDIDATVRCLTALGADISEKDGVYFVSPIKRKSEATLFCGESGSTLRFLIPVATALGGDITFTGEGRLPLRPCRDLAECLKCRGAFVDYECMLPLTTHGGLTAGEFFISGGVSSQFISGLIFALPLLSGDSTIVINGKIESLPYIEMTLSAVRMFGIKAEMSGNTIEIAGGQKYRAPKRISVEGDWSNAAFWAVLGALSDDGITVYGALKETTQGDSAVVDILKRFGAEVTQGEDFFTVKKGHLRAIRLNAEACPDLVPPLAVVAALANGETRIEGASRLRLKESDRIESTVKLLKDLGADAEETKDGIRIFGKSRLLGGSVSSFGDHRIAMSAAIAAAVCEKEVIIKGAEAVAKSYGDFFERIEELGASVIKTEV